MAVLSKRARRLVPIAMCAVLAGTGALYFRALDSLPVGGGLPAWTDGIIDTGCIATRGSAVALADRNGNIDVSADTGRSWSRRASGLPHPSSVLSV